MEGGVCFALNGNLCLNGGNSGRNFLINLKKAASPISCSMYIHRNSKLGDLLYIWVRSSPTLSEWRISGFFSCFRHIEQ